MKNYVYKIFKISLFFALLSLSLAIFFSSAATNLPKRSSPSSHRLISLLSSDASSSFFFFLDEHELLVEGTGEGGENVSSHLTDSRGSQYGCCFLRLFLLLLKNCGEAGSFGDGVALSGVSTNSRNRTSISSDFPMCVPCPRVNLLLTTQFR